MISRAHKSNFLFGKWRAAASSALRRYVSIVLMVTVAYYFILWISAWAHGAIPQSGDFYGNHGPWKRLIMQERWDGDLSIFLIMARLLVYPLFAGVGCLLGSLSAFLLKPGWKSVGFILVSLILGFVSFWHLILVD